jgi:glutamate N-acetyltransferase/amino-acid N-acetyltransferase
MKKIKGGITSPKGFKASAVTCGLKRSGKPDLALIYSEIPAAAAGVFTVNQVKAAPIFVSMAQIKSGIAQAIIANAGNANCWTGSRGMQDAWAMVKETAKLLHIDYKKVLVTSTGVIAHTLDINKVTKALPQLVDALSKNGAEAAATAILTTDRRKKEIAVKVGKITIAGIAKGAGMIAPGMATMHAFITTDAKIEAKLLQKLLRQAVDKTFNMISVDNCPSTNDCVFVLANGLSQTNAGKDFAKALEYVCEYLAKAIAADGEGATKLMTVKAIGAKTLADAKLAAKAVINSFLLKAAVYGKDRNTGRILQAVGATTARINWDKFKYSWKMGKEEDVITIDLGMGREKTIGWGCDLSEDYVKINAEYHT